MTFLTVTNKGAAEINERRVAQDFPAAWASHAAHGVPGDSAAGEVARCFVLCNEWCYSVQQHVLYPSSRTPRPSESAKSLDALFCATNSTIPCNSTPSIRALDHHDPVSLQSR